VIASFYNNNTTTGVRQSNGINIICGVGVAAGSNTAAITFGAPNATNSRRISTDGITGYSVLDINSTSTAGTIIRPAFSSTNIGDALTISLGSYTTTNNSAISGIMSMLRMGTGSAGTGRWSPASGSATLNMLIGAVYVNATGSYSGNIHWVTDDSVSLVSTGSGGTYYGYKASKNIGWGFYQTGSNARNAFMGNTLIGSTTDNGEKFQITGNLSLTTAGNRIKIAGGSNSTLGYATLSGGTAVVSNTSVTSNSHIFLQPLTSSLSGADLTVTSITLGTGFTITSSNASDNRSVSYLIIDN
jgi:hypothetical protein